VPGVLKEFKEFISRGNVVELAVAVIIGAAFTAIVTSVVEGLVTPLIGMIAGTDFREMTFTINDSVFSYGIVINAIIYFLVVSAVVFFLIVKPINVLNERRRRGEEPEPEGCPTRPSSCGRSVTSSVPSRVARPSTPRAAPTHRSRRPARAANRPRPPAGDRPPGQSFSCSLR
jgi:large conductance mechanosensitive channel